MNTKHLDGLPGITLQGKSGDKGSRGNTTYFNISLSISEGELIYNPEDFSTDPIENDYILNSKGDILYLYTIKDTNTHTVELLDTLSISNYINKNISLSISASTKTKLNRWIGNLDSDGKYIVTDQDESGNTAGIYYTYFIINSNIDISNLRIELEFKTKNLKVGHVSTCMNTVWGTKTTELVSSSIKNGLISQYSYKLNFDNEELRDFNLVIKDFNDSTTSVKKYIPIIIYNQIDNGNNTTPEVYNVYAYAYIKNKNTISKVFLKNMTEEFLKVKETMN